MDKNTAKELSIVEHLEELRRVLVISTTMTLAFAVIFYFFSDRILAILLNPVNSLGYKMVFVRVTEALMTKIKLSLFLGFIVALPIILWQVWGFILPALKKKERRFFTIFIVLSYLAFIAGLSFAFYVVYNLGISFFLRYAGTELLPMLTISSYLSFTIAILVPFGLLFQLPLALYLLNSLGIISYKLMKKSRKYIFLVILVISALFTPPDIFSMIIMAVPLYGLLEVSILMIGLTEYLKKRAARKAARQIQMISP